MKKVKKVTEEKITISPEVLQQYGVDTIMQCVDDALAKKRSGTVDIHHYHMPDNTTLVITIAGNPPMVSALTEAQAKEMTAAIRQVPVIGVVDDNNDD